MLCPVCKVELKMADRQGIEIDYCPQCRGVWLDRGELDKIIERSGTYAASTNTPTSGVSHEGRDVTVPHYQQSAPPPQVVVVDDDDYKYRDAQGRPVDKSGRPYQKKSFLGDIFDIFD